MTLITIDQNLCSRDGACIEACPYALITWGGDGFPMEVPNAGKTCIRCGHCVAVCDTHALKNAMLPREGFQEVALLNSQADPLGVLMQTRRSIRAFKEEPISRSELEPILNLARLAPTANNAQNLWWIVTTGRKETGELARLARDWMLHAYPSLSAADLPAEADPVLRGAPHLALCCGPEDSRWGYTDAAIAITHLDLLLSDRGFGGCWAGIFMRAADAWPALMDAMALPKGQRLYGGFFFGRPKRAFRLTPPRKPLAIDWR